MAKRRVDVLAIMPLLLFKTRLNYKCKELHQKESYFRKDSFLFL